MKKRILFVVNHAGFFLSHRLPLAVAARDAGYDVQIATPMSKHVPVIRDACLSWNPIQLSRSGRNPFQEPRTVASLYALYRRLRPDLIHHVTSKPVVYGTPIARALGIPSVVNAISGLGHVFSDHGESSALVRGIVGLGYRVALRHPRMRVIFQNHDHQRMFVERHWVQPEQCVLIPGSGADTNLFVPTVRSNAVPAVVFASRMLYTKGVKTFVDAARALREAGTKAEFFLVGEPDPDNPASVPEPQLKQWDAEGIVHYCGRRTDMPSVLARSDIFCLPTTYPEGIPKALVEAASCGLPIVTTDVPGCREIVSNGDNGLLVPPGELDAVVSALRTLIEDRGLRERMGARGRQLAVRDFSLSIVVEKTLRLYGELIA